MKDKIIKYHYIGKNNDSNTNESNNINDKPLEVDLKSCRFTKLSLSTDGVGET